MTIYELLTEDETEIANPWKTLTSKDIYENEWIILQEDKVISPGGTQEVYARIKYKKKTVGIIALDGNDNLWLVGQYRYPIDQYSWEIPGGGASTNEDILGAAKRELKEETGLTANKWKLILHMYTCNSITDEEAFVFLAKELFYGKMELGETERIILKKIPFRSALEMINNGLITDAVAIAGLLKLMFNENISNSE
jgi:8-oxo-dGTP pyrophosphatase MutT (NUDIX family)